MNDPKFIVEKQLWDATKPMCHLVQAGDFIWLSGVVAFDENGAVVGAGDIKAQARQIFTNVRRRLGMFGCDLNSIIRLTNYLTTPMEDMTFTRQYWEVRDEFFGNHRPASTGVQVVALMLPELMLEVDVVAYAPGAQIGSDARILNETHSRHA